MTGPAKVGVTHNQPLNIDRGLMQGGQRLQPPLPRRRQRAPRVKDLKQSKPAAW